MEKPSFDNWTIVFLLFSFLGFLIGVLINFQSSQNKTGKLFISLLLILFSLTLVDYVLYWTRYQIYFPHFAGVSTCFFLAFGPIIFCYVEIVYSGALSKKKLLHFLPFCIATVLFIPFLLADTAQRHEFIAAKSFYWWFFRIVSSLSILHIFAYSALVFNRRNAFNEFPLIKKWIGSLALGLAGIGFSFLLYRLLVIAGILTPQWDYMIAFSMVLFICTITVMAFLKPYVFDDRLPDLALRTIKNASENGNVAKYKNSPLDKDAGRALGEKLNRSMYESCYWRKNDLRLSDLAALMDFPKEYISQVINEQFGMNFFEFVNRYRVEEAKNLINGCAKEVTLIEIAYQVGFNNKVSFGKAFKAHAGMSPHEFRQSVRSAEVG